MSERSLAQATLGRAVRELRLERQMTQEALAHASDLHPTWISRVETGRLNPTWSNVVQICDALDLSLQAFGERVDRLRDPAA